MTYLILLISIFIWPFGQLLTFQVPGVLDHVYLLDIFLGLLTISLLVSKQNREAIKNDVIFKPLLIFNLVAALSLVVSLIVVKGDVFYPLLYLARLFAYPSIYFAVKLYPEKSILKYALASFSVFCLLGILQYLFLPDMRFLKLIGFDDHYYRLIGSFYDPNFTGAILSASALFFISLGNWIATLPILILLALTFSRASFLCFVAGLIYILIAKKRYSLFVFLLCLGVLIWLVPKPFGEGVNLLRTFSIFSRFESWKTGIDLFLQKPILGWGFNTLRSLTGERFQIDNSFLYVAATTGILGLVSFFAMMKQTFAGVSFPQQVFLSTLLFHSLFNNSFFYIWINFAFWIFLALPIKEYKPK